MKKLILILAILVVASPAFAVLDVNLVKLTGNQVQIRYTDADPCNLPRGFALVIEVNSTADVCGISAYKVGESNSTSKGYGIYPAKIQFTGTDQNKPTNWGTPVADQNDPLPTGGDQVLPSKKLVLEFGSLYAPVGSANAPDVNGNLCTLSYEPNGSTSFTIKMTGEAQYRITNGATDTTGVVFEDGTTADVNKSLTIGGAPPECLTLGQKFLRTICDPCLAADINVTTVIYNKWVWLGKPKCWCCPSQKCGNGIYTPAGTKNRVDATDLFALQASYLKMYTATGYNPCVDFQMSGRVDATDLFLLQAHYLKTVGSSGCM